MADRKIFAGGQLKRLRQRLGLSQTQMAGEIGVSPSYLNLIERNQRPLTVQVLLKLSSVYGVDVGELSGSDDAGTVEALKEAFSDPLLVGEIASPAELSDFADSAPNAAHGMVRLFEAYRDALERLSDLSQSLANEGASGGRSEGAGAAETATRHPAQRVAAYFEDRGPWIARLEEAAETVAAELTPRDDPAEALKAHLKERFSVDLRILPAHVMPVEFLRFDRHSMRLFISERVPLIDRPFLVARQIALIGHGELIGRLTEEAGLTELEAARGCRAAFVQRFAAAIVAPATRLAAAARDGGFDVLRLSQRFVLRPSRIMARLAALGAGVDGVPPAFVVMLDGSGVVLTRIPGAGFPFPRLAPLCARLPVFDGLVSERPVRADLALPDGSVFNTVAVAEDGPAEYGLAPPRRVALIGWRREDENGERGAAARPVGVTCRLCERGECAHRLQPSVAVTTGFQDHVVGPALFELSG